MEEKGTKMTVIKGMGKQENQNNRNAKSAC
jgi:hypothetical protein